MADYTVLRRIRLSAKHLPTGRTRHFYWGGQEVPPPAELIIAKYPDDMGYYLIHLDQERNELTDTYHDTLDQALDQAEWEFGITRQKWEIVGGEDSYSHES